MDSWGKILAVTGDKAASVGSNQPFRYRGYVYDEESGWYYLQSRYYDPSLGRFVSSDVYLSTGQGVLGHNSYAYCLNNPVNGADPSGKAAAAAAIGGAAIGDWLIGILIVAATVAAEALFPTATDIGVIKVGKTKAKAKTDVDVQAAPKVKERTDDPPKGTLIYRWSGANPGNLTPRQSDVKESSFSTIPRPGSVVTTIEALNATGVVMAIRDGANHVSVIPVGVPVKTWIDTGSNSIWTTAVKSVVVKFDGGMW